MVGPAPQAIGRRTPVVTGLVALIALAAYAIPGLSSGLVYDREAILSGELWRLATGSWVHFSAGHLLYDLVAFGIAGAAAERRGDPCFGLLCGTAALAIGPTLLLARPDLAYYGGLSGVAVGAVVFCALHGARRGGRGRRLWLAVLGVTAGKVLLEATAGSPGIASAADAAVVLCPESHVAGALAALVVFAGTARRRPARRPGDPDCRAGMDPSPAYTRPGSVSGQPCRRAEPTRPAGQGR